MNSSDLIINRTPFQFKSVSYCALNIKKAEGFELVGKKAKWLKNKLPTNKALHDWMEKNQIESNDFLAFNFYQDSVQEEDLVLELDSTTIPIFKHFMFIQDFGNFLRRKGLLIEPNPIEADLSAFEILRNFDDNWELFRRLDFKWKPKREELIINIGSNRTFISSTVQNPDKGQKIVDESKGLIHKCSQDDQARVISKEDLIKKNPEKFSYKSHYQKLKELLQNDLSDYTSNYFDLSSTSFNKIENYNHVFRDNNFMIFGNNKTAKNAIVGMREYGPYKKLENPNAVKLLFIYRNRDDANQLYLKLKKGEKHFPGLLSYTGIPVALAEERLPYEEVENLPENLCSLLSEDYPDNNYNNTLAIVIGPFKKGESNEEENVTYYDVKKQLLEKGIASQFVNESLIKDTNFHYSLPNIAIAILAKLGGVPWKLNTKRKNDLVIGFNTKKIGNESFLGTAVFFNNEGELGTIKGFKGEETKQVLEQLRNSIKEYYRQLEKQPERIVIHYYKPPKSKEIKDITELLSNEFKNTPFSILEINDTKSKLDICFDAEYGMGMPQSGTYAKVGASEYLLFNNNRFIKKTPHKVEDELPIKLRIAYADQEVFHNKELISQVYEFSRLNWKGLKQRSQPVTTIYAKLIAEFSAHFSGEILNETIAQKRPWFL